MKITTMLAIIMTAYCIANAHITIHCKKSYIGDLPKMKENNDRV